MARHKRRRKTFRPPSAGDPPERGGDDGPGERLQKVLAAAGVGSRRDCEELIREGRVEVDRQAVTELGTRVDPLRHEIRVDGEPLRQPTRLYYAVNKPSGVVTTNFDPSGRPRVVDLVPTDERVFAVGRLDRASEGLILVTNDGEFANRITHPRYGVEKTYLARVAGAPTPADLARLRKGVYLSDGMCRVQSIIAKKRHGKSADLVIVLNEGRNRELRRILARVGHKVLRLKRIAVGPIKLADLPSGAWRRLMPNEIETLLHLAKEKRKASKAKRKGVKTQSGMKPVHGERPQSPYLQQQALMAEPLSLEDLLKDDLDDGGVMLGGPAGPADDATDLQSNSPAGGVIDYQDEHAVRQSAPGQAPRTPAAGRGKRPFRPKSKRRGNGQRTDRVAKTGGRKFGKPGGKRSGRPGGKRKGRR